MRTHFGYIVGILVAVIILLLAVKWTNIPNLANYLNFALGVTSIVLAIVAIIYAFFSNNSLIHVTHNIQTSATSVADATKTLHESLSSLSRLVEEIPIAIKTVEGKILETHELVRTSMQQRTNLITPQDELVSKIIDYFVSVSSWNGVKVLYLCARANLAQKKFDLRAWTDKDPSITFDYACGYLIASSSVGFFNHQMEGTIVNVPYFAKGLAEAIYKAVPEKLSQFEEPAKSNFGAQIEYIDSFLK